MMRILTWNTLESGDGGAFSDGWGCPLEIYRRDELAKVLKCDINSNVSSKSSDCFNNEENDDDNSSFQTKAEKMLTQERQERIRKAILREIYRESDSSSSNNDPFVDFMLFQEVTVGDLWDDNPFFFSETISSTSSTSSDNISISSTSTNSSSSSSSSS
eukprot:CAMPEP_0168187098 /NCGR_PEP_ID=MMETSP0139_2-20121125/14828_1 /TAXON_ID=44445 /ORGANISM="Pseudo-nitzschia australis, Strain 10249 10 AB" /LENGTH=158 /DNA_ID=CAMNT_0008109237 /DNA_START=139 /DNA_END=612 /DNA_ORIENTATION=-